MNIDWVRRYCMSLPHTTESVQWGNDLVFKIGGKMFAVAVLEPAKVWLSFKCSPEEFADFGRAGREMGFAHVESGPLVRSSYHASDALSA